MKLKKWLSVFLAAAMVVSVLPESRETVYASEFLKGTKDEAGQETAADSAEEQTGDLQVERKNAGSEETAIKEEAVEEQTFYASDDIAGGTDNNITWSIDAEGMLTVSGFGDVSSDADGRLLWPWRGDRGRITSAKVNVTGMTNAGCMFYQCDNLSSLDVSGFDTSNVITMGAMFMGCSSLSSLDVSKFDTSNVTGMAWMFVGCSSLSSLDVSKFNTSNVIGMSGMFRLNFKNKLLFRKSL